MPLKSGHSHEIVSANIKELMKAGHSQRQSMAIALKEARKAKKMAMGGEVEQPENLQEGISMEPPAMRDVESGGPDLSNARDRVDSGEPEERDYGPVDKGSPKSGDGASTESEPFMSEDLKEMIRKRKARYAPR